MEAETENPLLTHSLLPAFERIEAAHVGPAIEALVRESRDVLRAIEADSSARDWNQVVAPLAEAKDRLSRAWSPVSHLHAVADTDAIRAAYNESLGLLSEHATELAQSSALYGKFRALADHADFASLPIPRKAVIDHALRDFELAGVSLNASDKARFKVITAELARQSSRFSENVLDASKAWSLHITNEERLSGIPATVKTIAAESAREESLQGWLLNLDFPCYFGVMSHAEDRELRREMHRAYSCRASDQGPHAGKWDNSDTMARILALRHEQAQLLGKANYAELSLARKMADEPAQVVDFLNSLAGQAKPAAQREMAELRDFARKHLGLEDVQAPDIAFCAERLRRHKFDVSQEELRPYFPVPRVLLGLFAIVRQLFGITLSVRDAAVQTWHQDVLFIDLWDESGALIGHCYADLYARPHKRGGAWMDECTVRRRLPSGLQLPVAYVTCNFTPPAGGPDALLTHSEVTTLFHEFGHALHHLLTRVEEASVSGINGVSWDAVELPSQLMENWCWEREGLDLLASHHQTGETLPAELLDRLRAARTFQTGMQTVRQLEFALFDFRIHLEYDPRAEPSIYRTLEEVRRGFAVVPAAPYDRFAHAFTHIFCGGYAAGYYSYKWAEALSADAYSLFQETGILNRSTGDAFKRTILEQGGSRAAMELFKEFRGREPDIDALLRRSGLRSSGPVDSTMLGKGSPPP